MKMSYPITVLLAIMLAGCSTTGQSPTRTASNFINRQSVDVTTPEKYPVKNPQTVSFYMPGEPPYAAYRVIGVAKVSRFNILGMKRKPDDMHERMRDLAASIGGDGLINIEQNDNTVRANVIAFQKIIF